MLGNTIGRMFRVTACGESYGDALVAIIDGCPAGLDISDAQVQKELDARRPGPARWTLPGRRPTRCTYSRVYATVSPPAPRSG